MFFMSFTPSYVILDQILLNETQHNNVIMQ